MLTNTHVFHHFPGFGYPESQSVICFVAEVNEPCYIRKCGKMGILLTVKMWLVYVGVSSVRDPKWIQHYVATHDNQQGYLLERWEWEVFWFLILFGCAGAHSTWNWDMDHLWLAVWITYAVLKDSCVVRRSQWYLGGASSLWSNYSGVCGNHNGYTVMIISMVN